MLDDIPGCPWWRISVKFVKACMSWWAEWLESKLTIYSCIATKNSAVKKIIRTINIAQQYHFVRSTCSCEAASSCSFAAPVRCAAFIIADSILSSSCPCSTTWVLRSWYSAWMVRMSPWIAWMLVWRSLISASLWSSSAASKVTFEMMWKNSNCSRKTSYLIIL